MLIATFNCNSIRVRLQIILDWLAENQPDCLALQETKVVDDLFPIDAFVEAGWKVAYRGQKAYNGVAMITREEPTMASFGFGDGDDGESEPRLAHIELGDVSIINTYVPQGKALDTPNFTFKLEWYERLKAYFAERFDFEKDAVVWVGDLNVAPTPEDVYDHDKIWPHVCHCQEIADALQSITRFGLVDIFRKHIGDEKVFTYWDYRMPWAVKANQGWRIDHIWASRPYAASSQDCWVDIEPRKKPKPSDHTFVAARFS